MPGIATTHIIPPRIENPEFLILLKSKNIIPDDFVQDLLNELDGNVLDVLCTLIQSGVATKKKLCQLWCNSIGIGHVDLEKTLFQSNVVRMLPERLALMYCAIPIYKMGNTITVASATPDNSEIAASLEKLIGYPVSMVFALPQEIEAAIVKEYRSISAIDEFFNKIPCSFFFKKGAPITSDELRAVAGDEGINQLNICVILYGLTQGASEVHILPEHDSASIAVKTGESVEHRMDMSRSIHDQLILRIKALSGMDLTLTVRPQHGRMLFPTPGKKIDLGVATRPSPDGEAAILSLTHSKPLKKIKDLNEHHISCRIIHKIENRISRLKGLFLITGPPRSGKTELAYSVLNRISMEKRKIITVEEAVLFLVPGTDQYRINPKAGFTASDALSECLKQRPEAIYIQNIKDNALTERASTAALSGQFVLAGIEAAGSLDALKTAMELGIAQSVNCIMSQRLAARLCDHCKTPYPLPPKQVDMLFRWDGKTEVVTYREKGCPYCRDTGFSGRIGLHELLSINNRLRKLIMKGRPAEEIYKAIEPDDFISMRYDGIKKALRGLTTIDEVYRIPA
ncbi:MAG: Flp pilus assembly complex ATPase component [Deltaproteobacteria bacterium]|nr:Flp pilus assembly complex ATPase component [Deltaproteobacteria bacterium]